MLSVEVYVGSQKTNPFSLCSPKGIVAYYVFQQADLEEQIRRERLGARCCLLGFAWSLRRPEAAYVRATLASFVVAGAMIVSTDTR